MTSAKELKEWLATIPDEHGIAIDDEGLRLVAIDEAGEETGAYNEIGGVPSKDGCECGGENERDEVGDLVCKSCGLVYEDEEGEVQS